VIGEAKKRHGKGAVYVEFLIVFFPMMMLFFGLAHLGLVYGAHLLVEHAAARAARAAIVILPDEQTEDYEEVEINQVGTGGHGLDAYKDAPDGGRLDQIRMAARLTLSPISPSIESYVGESLADALGDHQAASTFVGLAAWTDKAVAVTFPDGNDGYLSEFSPRSKITARVTYLYKCSVPIIRSLVCHPYAELEGRARNELETFGAGGLMAGTSLVRGWRFIAITAERTLPNQGKS
jgi:hypothetical protein